MRRIAFVLLTSAVCLASPVAAGAQLSVSINVGPPPVVFATPPYVVAVPDTRVYYAPEVGINLFVYEGRYYSFHDGGWFLASTHHGPWVALPVARVPRPVLAVPVQYYRIPPEHVRTIEDEDHGRGHRGCPPGLAKQGRC